MPYRVCPMCNQSSYIANIRELWSCPHCGYDLTYSQWDVRTARQIDPSLKPGYLDLRLGEKI